MYSYGPPPHMAEQKQDDQLEHTYIQQLCEDTGCSSEDLPEAMNEREKWRERSVMFVLAARYDDDDNPWYAIKHSLTSFNCNQYWFEYKCFNVFLCLYFQVLTAIIVQVERLKGAVTSPILFIYWLFTVFAEIIPFYSRILQHVSLMFLS